MDRRKMLIIFGGAWISAALLTWFLYAKTVAPQHEKTVQAVAVVRDMSAGTRLRPGDLKLVNLAEKDLPKTAVLDRKAAVDRVLLYPVNASETLTTSKLTGLSTADGIPATIAPGRRAVSVPITDVSAAGGLVQPRSRVDVLFTRSGSLSESLTTLILEDVEVMSVGRLTEAGQPVDPRAPRSSQQAATLLVTPEESRKLEFAKNHGKISLALRNPLDRSTIQDNTPATAFDIDPMFDSRAAARRRQLSAKGVPNLRDDKVWAQLGGEEEKPKKVEEKKEPPRPRFIVDVYRGDKHVQETFQD